jgi:hypothetical protein
MTIRRLLVILLVVLFPGSSAMDLFGQLSDFNSWFEINLARQLGERVELSTELEQRFSQNSSRFERSMVTLTADYRIREFLGVAGGGRLMVMADEEGDASPRYWFHADVKGKRGMEQMDLSIRIRMQYSFREVSGAAMVSDNQLVNRVMGTLGYQPGNADLGLFASLESWALFYSGNNHFFNRVRYSAGVTYDFTARAEVGLRYILEDEFNQEDPVSSHIVVINYSQEL